MGRDWRRSMIPSILLLAVLAGGCGGPEGSGGPLRIAAAADLQRVLPKLLEAYGDRDGPVAPPTFGASGDLAEQIRGGAPFDVFLSADLTIPKALEGEEQVESMSVAPYARGSLVMLVHPSVADKVASISDLASPEVRKIAVANYQVAPYGRAARDALEKAGLWEPLGPKLVISGSVSQALLHVEQGNAEAALVSRSLAEGVASKVVEIDPALYPPRNQGVGVVNRSPRKTRARRFIAFLLSEEGRRIFDANGFGPPIP